MLKFADMFWVHLYLRGKTPRKSIRNYSDWSPDWYPMMNIFILMRVVFYKMTITPSTGLNGAQDGLRSMKMMWIVCHVLLSHQISTRLNTSGRSSINMIDNTTTLINPVWVWRTVFIPPVQFQPCRRYALADVFTQWNLELCWATNG